MKFTINWNWDNAYGYDEGMLFFAQRVEEMLMSYTTHLYKVPALNTYTLIHEYAETAQLVGEKILNKTHLSVILDEFYCSLSKDVILQRHYSDDEIRYFIGQLKGKSEDDRDKFMHYLWHEFSQYPIWCKEEIVRAVKNFPEKKNDIDKILRALIPALIFGGYHPNYIYWECKHIFSRKKISSASPLDIFLGRFTFTGHTYTVYFAVSKKVEAFRQALEARLNFSFQQDKYSEQLEFNRDEYICVHVSTKALDRNRAAEAAYGKFSLFVRYCKFLGNRNDDLCQDKALVLEGDHVYTLHLKPPRYSYSWNYDYATLGSNAEKIITSLLSFASFKDFGAVEKMIINHNAALESPENANSFLNLWSVLEIAGVSGRDDIKINEILDAAVPVLKKNYARNIFKTLHSYIKANIPDEDYMSLFSGITEEGGKIFQTACLVTLAKYKDAREQASRILEDYPLVRYRMLDLSSGMFSNKSKFLEELARYGQRLRWHIQRLYRTRNSITHSGDVPGNIKLLSEHLHEYADELIMTIIYKLAREESLATISNVIIDAQVFISKIQREYKRDNVFTDIDVKFLLTGK